MIYKFYKSYKFYTLTLYTTSMKAFLPVSILAVASLTSACGPHKQAAVSPAPIAVGWSKPLGSAPVSALPKTVIYRTDGDYARYVPVTLNDDRNALVSFPAPGDVRGGNPVALADGFWLDRRGIGPNTAFTRWTYEEYAALPAAPSPAEIMANLIPDARVTEVYRLPFAPSAPDAAASCDSVIAAGMQGAEKIFPTP